jgi:hypothetical protein
MNGPIPVAGKVAGALSFDGVNDYVSIPHYDALQPAQITVDAWIKGDPLQGGPLSLVVDKSHGFGDFTGWVFQIDGNSGSIYFHYGDGSDFPGVNSTSNVLDDDWHFVAAAVGGGMMKLYVDGVLEDSDAYSGTPAGNTRPVNIGAAWGGGTFQRFFRGLIDEVEIYDRVLSADEIADLFNAGSEGKCKPVPPPPPPPPSCVTAPADLVSWWPGDGDATDIEGGYNGTLVNGASFAAGFVSSGTGQAFSLDGVNDFVSMPHSAALEPAQITVDAWIKAGPSQGGDLSLVVDKSHGAIDATGWVIQIDRASGRVHFNSGNGSSFPGVASTSNVLDDSWHFIAATLDGSTMKMYVDGALETSAAYSGTPAGNMRGVNIGGWWGGGGFHRWFKGLIDEVEIYNRALSADEIADIFNAGSGGKCKP